MNSEPSSNNTEYFWTPANYLLFVDIYNLIHNLYELNPTNKEPVTHPINKLEGCYEHAMRILRSQKLKQTENDSAGYTKGCHSLYQICETFKKTNGGIYNTVQAVKTVTSLVDPLIHNQIPDNPGKLATKSFIGMLEAKPKHPDIPYSIHEFRIDYRTSYMPSVKSLGRNLDFKYPGPCFTIYPTYTQMKKDPVILKTEYTKIAELQKKGELRIPHIPEKQKKEEYQTSPKVSEIIHSEFIQKNETENS